MRKAVSFSGKFYVSTTTEEESQIEKKSEISQNVETQASKPVIDLLYDSNCHLCMMEVRFLRKRDTEGKIRFTDLNSPDYVPEQHGNVKFEDGMRKIRAVLPDNTVVVGVEVFHKTYEAIGLGWIFHLTNFPIVGNIADSLYDLWAENRLRITGRGELVDVIKKHNEEIEAYKDLECDSDACGMDYDDE